MARIYNPTIKQIKAWTRWVKSRPPKVQEIAQKFVPWELYRLKSSGHRVTIFSIQEPVDGSQPTLSVTVSGVFNKVAFARNVFGIAPEDLEPCELPGEDEELGETMTPEEAEENIDEIRLTVRPDLWVMGPDGKAVRKN